MKPTRMTGTGHPLEGRRVTLPGGETALVLSVEHEYDDGTTLRYLDGPSVGHTTMRDTWAIRRCLGEPPYQTGWTGFSLICAEHHDTVSADVIRACPDCKRLLADALATVHEGRK